MIKFQIEQRLQQLNWTLYKLSKQVATTKAARVGEEPSAATRYHSAIGKALENPARSKLETIQEIVEALGGTLSITWGNKPGFEPMESVAPSDQLYLVKFFEKEGVRVSASTTLKDAISELLLGHNKETRVEIWNANLLIWSSEMIPTATHGYTVVAHTDPLPLDNSWLCTQ